MTRFNEQNARTKERLWTMETKSEMCHPGVNSSPDSSPTKQSHVPTPQMVSLFRLKRVALRRSISRVVLSNTSLRYVFHHPWYKSSLRLSRRAVTCAVSFVQQHPTRSGGRAAEIFDEKLFMMSFQNFPVQLSSLVSWRTASWKLCLMGRT